MWDSYRDKVETLAGLDQTHQVPGAALHRWVLAPAPGAEAVAAWEAAHGPLPEGLAAFYSDIADGGPAPGGRLKPLAELTPGADPVETPDGTAPADAAGTLAWLDTEITVFKVTERLFNACKTFEDFRSGFAIQYGERPPGGYLTSLLGLRYHDNMLGHLDPEPDTVQYRWYVEHFRRYKARGRFKRGAGRLLDLFPRSGRVSKG